MSDRQLAKNRHHKGLSAHLRQTMRKVGVSLDEETAQFVLSGLEPFEGPPSEALLDVVNQTFGDKRALMKKWEEEHPGKNPWPPSFPERVLRLVREAVRQAEDEDGDPRMLLHALEAMCLQELETSPVTVDPLLLEDA